MDEYGLSNDFDVDSLLNLVPSHRYCNLQKKGQVLTKSRAIHFLSIAEDRHNTACKIELELKEQALRDKFTVILQVALDEGRISREELSSLVAGYAESQNMFEVLTTLPFVDSELKGFISSTDVDSLYDRPILPRLHGLDKLTMVKATLSDEEKIEVRTCREWAKLFVTVTTHFQPMISKRRRSLRASTLSSLLWTRRRFLKIGSFRI